MRALRTEAALELGGQVLLLQPDQLAMRSRARPSSAGPETHAMAIYGDARTIDGASERATGRGIVYCHARLQRHRTDPATRMIDVRAE